MPDKKGVHIVSDFINVVFLLQLKLIRINSESADFGFVALFL